MFIMITLHWDLAMIYIYYHTRGMLGSMTVEGWGTRQPPPFPSIISESALVAPAWGRVRQVRVGL